VVFASAVPKSTFARSVCSGTRPSRYHSLRPISVPPRRPAGRDLHAEGAGTHRGLHGAAHRAAERHAALQLLGDVLRKQRGVGLGPDLARGLVHVLDLHVDALLRVALDVLAEAIHLGALPADHDARPRRADEHPDLVTLALDVDRRDAGARETRLDVLADPDVLMEELGVVTPGIPVALPGVDDTQPEPIRVDLVSPLDGSLLVVHRAHDQRHVRCALAAHGSRGP
jgi:hypothetical protein